MLEINQEFGDILGTSDKRDKTERSCLFCGVALQHRDGEKPTHFSKRKYCNSKCADDMKKDSRPEGWERLHNEARKFRKEHCESCGLKESLHAHHIDGEIKNNTHENIQTLCTWCHNFRHAVSKRLGLGIPGKMPELQHG